MAPFYKDETTRLYCGDAREVLPTLDDRVDLVLTDPPYAKRVCDGARSLKGGKPAKLIDFPLMTSSEVRAVLAMSAGMLDGWLLSFLDWQQTAKMEANPIHGLKFITAAIWIKPNAAPCFAGNGPAMGYETIAVCHSGGKRTWAGGGQHGVYTYPRVHTPKHPAEKPLALLRRLIELFAEENAVVLDPFCGSGSTLHAAKLSGCRAIGIELEERFCEFAANRLRQRMLF